MFGRLRNFIGGFWSSSNSDRLDISVPAITAAVESYRDARMDGPTELAMWRPRLASADKAILADASKIRARARDLVRNNVHAKNAVRMVRDSVSGSGLKLALAIDWRTLGIKDIEAAAEWQDHVTRLWEAWAESTEFEVDARRQLTFSQLFALADVTDFVDGESLAVIEMKEGFGEYRTCLNLVDVDRLSNPLGMADQSNLRGGISRDVYGEPIAYHIREGHPADVGLGLGSFTWKEVPRVTPWGRPIVLHSFDHGRPEQSRGVSEFAAAITPMKMLQQYEDTELQSAIVQAAYAAVIKTELDWSSAMNVLGAEIRGGAGSVGGNPMMNMVTAHLTNAAKYYEGRDITWQGAKIPHLLPNESLDVIKSTHPNSNFDNFENNFIRKFAAGLGVEAHELAKNYKDVNYSAARAALLAVWRTYRTRRNRRCSQFAMPFFRAWLEEGVAIGSVRLPDGVSDFFAASPYLVKGTFIAWGKPMVDPLKERQAQNLGMQMGVETMQEIAAEEGQNWRDNLDQIAYERRYREKLGIPDPALPGVPPGQIGAPVEEKEDA